MASEGPTTTGSINAKIGATVTELQEKIAEAKGLVKELTGQPTNVKVGANVDEAIGKLSAVEAAQRRLNTSTQSLQLAYQRLDEVQTKGGASESRLMALHLAATRAENAHADAVRNLAAAQAAESVAEDDNTEATKRSNNAQKDNLQHWQMIAIAVAALIPLLGPLAGYAVGVAGALGAMGAAGVLAIVGIKHAIQDGTAAGNQYALGLQALKGDLDELSNTAATAMLQSWNTAIGQINAALPSLNTATGLFAKQLGNVGNFLIGTVLIGFRTLEPLLLTAGVYVEQLAAGMLKFTQGSGLQTFTQYAISQLPKVAQTLGELATLAIRLIEATAPIGTVVLQAITAFSAALNAVPLPVLTALVAGGGAFFLAFKAWTALTPILQSVAVALGTVGAAEDLALGPIGLVIAAVTALGAAVGVTAVSMQQATTVQSDYTAAVQQDNGVIGKNVELQAAKNLQDEGAFKNAKQLGIATNDLVKAALGDADAKKRVNDALDKQAASYKGLSEPSRGALMAGTAMTMAQLDLKKQVDATRASLDEQGSGVKAAIKAFNDLQNAIGGVTVSTQTQLQAEQDAASKAGVSLGVYEQAKAHQRDLSTQLEQTTADMYVQGDAAGLLKQSLDLLNGKTLNAAQAQNQFDSQIANMSDHFDQTGKFVDRMNALLTGNTAAAVKNRGELISLTQAAEQNAEAFRDNGGSAEETRQKLIAMKQAIVDNAVAHGEDRDQVQQFIDTIFKIPASIPPTKLEVDDADALAKLNNYKAILAQISNVDVINTVRVSQNLAPLGPRAYATGGTVGGFADGGSWGTVLGPGSTTSDSILTRLSTQEEVTKASSANYPGVRPLLKAINYDPSGVMNALTRPHGTSHTTVHNWYVTNAVDPTAVATEVDRRQNMRVA